MKTSSVKIAEAISGTIQDYVEGFKPSYHATLVNDGAYLVYCDLLWKLHVPKGKLVKISDVSKVDTKKIKDTKDTNSTTVPTPSAVIPAPLDPSAPVAPASSSPVTVPSTAPASSSPVTVSSVPPDPVYSVEDNDDLDKDESNDESDDDANTPVDTEVVSGYKLTEYSGKTGMIGWRDPVKFKVLEKIDNTCFKVSLDDATCNGRKIAFIIEEYVNYMVTGHIYIGLKNPVEDTGDTVTITSENTACYHGDDTTAILPIIVWK
jgi:hypothetical protein